jgi:glycosyltransferase involved in cell wall biosynthesis
MAMHITARINTLNEEDNIAAVLAALAWADECLVVDAGSTDATVEIARRQGARVLVHPFENFAAQHTFADSQCRTDWVLVLDADERLSAELASSLRQLQQEGGGDETNGGVHAYLMARRAWYMGRWIWHSGWYPDWKLRLYRRSHTRWEGELHERPVLMGAAAGATRRLQGDLLHYPFRDRSEHDARIERYTDLAAAADFRRGRRLPLWRWALAPPAAFLRTYMLQQGFRDGRAGWVIALQAARYVRLKQAKLRAWRRHPPGDGNFPLGPVSTPAGTPAEDRGLES